MDKGGVVFQARVEVSDSEGDSLGEEDILGRFKTPRPTFPPPGQGDFTPQKRVGDHSGMPVPLFRITKEDPLQPIEVALRMCVEEHRPIYKSFRGVGVALRTNAVARPPEMV